MSRKGVFPVLKRLIPCLLLATAASAQTMIDWNTQIRNRPLVSNNAVYTKQSASTSAGVGGYIQLAPVTYPNELCKDVYGNPVNTPVPAAGFPPFGPNDAIMWNSLSPLPGVDPPGCGPAFTVQEDYGLNFNVYLLAMGGLSTTLNKYNSVQSLGGGMTAGSYTAGTLYGGGTVVCTAMAGTNCTATTVLAGAAYLGGHVDIGHSNGPPVCAGAYPCADANRSINTATNPLTGGEGLVQGMQYFDDGTNCFNGYYGTAGPKTGWHCIDAGGGGTPAGVTGNIQFNSCGTPPCVFGADTTFNFDTVRKTIVLTGPFNSGINAPVFSSSNITAGVAAFTNGPGTFYINGDGTAGFQNLNVGTGSPFQINTLGDTTLHSITITGTCTGCGAGNPAGGNAQVQYNSSGLFGASSHFTFGGDILTLGGNSVTGVIAPLFNSSNTGSSHAFQAGGGAFIVFGSGDVQGQTYKATTVFNSLADVNGGNAFQTSGGNVYITGAGAAGFQSLGVGATVLPATTPPFTVSILGNTALHNLTVTGTCTGCGAGNPAGMNTQVQFNSSGVFGGASTFTFSGDTLSLSGSSVTGVVAPVHNSTNTGTDHAFQTQSGNYIVFGNGQTEGFSFKAHGVFNSQADVFGGNAFQTSGGNVTITGAGYGAFQTLGVGTTGPPFTINTTGDTVLHNLTVNGACTGCGAGNPSGGNTQVQYNSGGVFGASSLFTFAGNTLTLGGGVTTGVIAPVFNSPNTGTDHAFQANMGAFLVLGSGDVTGQSFASTTVFNSHADVNGGNAFQTSGGNVTITGAGYGAFQTLGVGTTGPPFTIDALGNTITHNITITGTCTGCGASNPGGANTQVQFNSGGVFGGSASLTWNGTALTTNDLTVTGTCTGCSSGGVSSFNTRTGAVTMQASDVTAAVQDLRTAASPTFFNVSATNIMTATSGYSGSVYSCTSTGSTNCLQQLPSANFTVTGAGDAKFHQLTSTAEGLFQTYARIGNIGYAHVSTAVLEMHTGTASNVNITGITSPTAAAVIASVNDLDLAFSGLALVGLPLVLQPTGNPVLVNTYTDSGSGAKLQVNGAATVVANGGYGVTVTNGGASAGYSANNITGIIMGATTTGNTMMSLVDSGGSCTLKGSTALSCTSDIRLKKDIVPVASSLDRINALEPIEYKMKGNGDVSVGFDAAKVQKLFPIPVGSDDNGMLTMSYTQLVPYLVKAIQEQQKQIDALTLKLARSGSIFVGDPLPALAYQTLNTWAVPLTPR